MPRTPRSAVPAAVWGLFHCHSVWLTNKILNEKLKPKLLYEMCSAGSSFSLWCFLGTHTFLEIISYRSHLSFLGHSFPSCTQLQRRMSLINITLKAFVSCKNPYKDKYVRRTHMDLHSCILSFCATSGYCKSYSLPVFLILSTQMFGLRNLLGLPHADMQSVRLEWSTSASRNTCSTDNPRGILAELGLCLGYSYSILPILFSANCER